MLKVNQRGSGRDIARHLLKQENDYVEVHELRGFMSDDLVSALKETHMISRAKKYLYSLSVNSPEVENVSPQDLLNAIVFHEKKGRRYAHAVWVTH